MSVEKYLFKVEFLVFGGVEHFIRLNFKFLIIN